MAALVIPWALCTVPAGHLVGAELPTGQIRVMFRDGWVSVGWREKAAANDSLTTTAKAELPAAPQLASR